jgi:hypothetical protein
MADKDIVQRVKSLLYGTALGEAPPIVQLANEPVDGSSVGTTVTVTFLDATEAGKVEAGDILSVYNAATADDAHSIYVLSKSGTAVTGVNGYWGSPLVADGDLDDALLELNPLRAEHFLFQAVESVFATFLWPDVLKYNQRSVTPSLKDYQVDVPAAVEQILSAWQIVGDTRYTIPFKLAKDLETNLTATGNMGEFYAIDGSTVYYTTEERYLSDDTLSEALTHCIATGAAALALGASISETKLAQSGKNSETRGDSSVADKLWREFVTLRSALADDIARDVDWFEIRR